MKIALVLCPALYKRCPLIGLGYLSSYLRAKDYDVDIFDLNTMIEIPYEEREDYWGDRKFVERYISSNLRLLESLADRIMQSNTEIIGFSIWTTTKYFSLALARAIKQRDNNRLIVFGGPDCSFSTQELMADGAVDIVVYGEGEETLYEIAEIYRNYRKINSCAGTVIKNNDNLINCGFRDEIENLNSIPFPDFSDFLLNNYYLPNTLPITFYRGCSRRCVFCNASVTWRRFRSRTAENIYKEMRYRKILYPGLKKFEIDDTALNLNLKMISRLCDLIIADGFRIDWGGAAIIHPDMDFALLKKMAKAGCKSLAYGLESGAQDVIDSMRKGFKIEDAERLICDTYHAGIEVDLNIIIGFPNETEYEFQQTMEFIRRNRAYISFISFPSECWIGNQTFLHLHPEEFNVEPGKWGNLWQTKNGRNTHQVRQQRIEVFNNFVSSLGLPLHNYATTVKDLTKK
jgi:radical SAM superfamily enzyme YgiQ (UPF0313 family)